MNIKPGFSQLNNGLRKFFALVFTALALILLFQIINIYIVGSEKVSKDRIFLFKNGEVRFPKDVWQESFTFSYEPSAYEHTKTFSSIVPSLKFTANDREGSSIAQLDLPFKITYTYNTSDLKNIKEDTLSFYRYNQKIKKWEAIFTELDVSKNTATTQSVHVTRYALMGEIIDKIAPETFISIEGKIHDGSSYNLPVKVKMSVKDNEGGLGIADTLYKLNDEEWIEYTYPITLTESGNYTIQFMSQDKAGNNEVIKQKNFLIKR